MMKPSGRSLPKSEHPLKDGYSITSAQAFQSVSDGDYENRPECRGVHIDAL